MSETDWTYITRDFEVVTGEAARPLVEKTNDRRYLTRDAGIHTVSIDRWKLAQDAERHHWLDLRPHLSEDRNMDHAFMYDRYSAIAGKTFENAIELGCGPFTNMAVLAQRCTIKRLSLLDPLVEDYLGHANCTYRDGSLRLQSGQALPVAERIAKPVEQFQPESRYDLVVMLNVIEHCYNVPVIFRKIWEMTAPGGLVLFHDRYFDHAQVAKEAERIYDAAHPLKVDRKMIDGFLARFERVFFRFITTEGLVVHAGEGDQVYFVGRKPEAA
jgi:SAM-dependent methyltransferase